MHRNRVRRPSPPLQKKSGAIKRQTSLSVSKEYAESSFLFATKMQTPLQICKGVIAILYVVSYMPDGKDLKYFNHTITVYKYGVNSRKKLKCCNLRRRFCAIGIDVLNL